MNMQKRLTLEDVGGFLEKLAEKSESVYWLSSHDFTKIEYISHAYEKIWGRSREILYKNPELWITYLHPDDSRDHHPISAMAERLVKLGPAARYEENYRIVRPDGEIRWIIDRGFPIYDEEGHCCGVTGVAVDVTKEKKVEEALREAKEAAEAANKAKTEFLANMRHDLRTPLTGIIGCARLIKEEAGETKIGEYADNMLASSYALLDFLNEILEAIRVASGEIPIVKKKFNLKNKLEQITALLKIKAQEKRTNLSLQFDERIPNYLVGDSKRIQRILLELLSNAIKFTEQGDVAILVELAKQKNDDVVIKLAVADSGVGIPKDKQQEIFLQFSRLAASYEGVYKGAGLGLTIVKQFTDDLNGEIYVASEPNKGSIFTCFIPLKLALVNDEFGADHDIEVDMPAVVNFYHEVAVKSVADTGGASSPSSTRVLVVEDQPIAAQVVEAMLHKLNCVVDVAETGQTALMLAKKENYDFIFMDVGLPDMSGNEVTQKIREWEMATDRHVPIIALTAHIDTHEKQKCVEAGMDAALSKPLSFETARDILQAFVPKRMAAKNAQRAVKAAGVAKVTPDLPEQTVDLDTGAKMYGGNVAMAKEILKMLADSLSDELAQLEKAHQANDWKTIKKIIHKMRGGASYCGAVRLQAVCRCLEEAVSVGKTNEQEQVYQQVLSEMAAVQKYAASL